MSNVGLSESSRIRRRAPSLLWLVAAPVTVVALLLALGFLVKQGRTRTPSPGEIKQVFPEDPQPSSAVAATGLDVYIDGSGSMHGFLAKPSSVFRQTVSDVLLSATQSGFDLSVFRFSTKIERVTRPPMSAVQDPQFYTGLDTPLASLLTQIEGHPDRTAIVMSDLVLSSKKEDSQGLVKAMAALAANRPEIQLRGFRSDFHGAYTSERSSGEKLTLSADQSLPDTGRPFYMIIVAPNATSMDKVEKDLLNHVQAQSNKFVATSPAFTVQGVALTPGTAGKQWTPVSRFLVRDQERNRFETAFRVAQRPAGETVELPLTITYASYVPFSRASELSLTGQVATYSKRAGSKATAAPAPSVPHSGQANGWGFSPASDVTVSLRGEQMQPAELKQPVEPEQPGDTRQNEKMRLTVRLQTPAAKQWNVYRLKLRPGESNLDLPGWTREWSTDDDSVAANGNKTYLLRLLVGTMESAITQERVCGDWILKIGGEE